MTVSILLDGTRRRVEIPAGFAGGIAECRVDTGAITADARMLEPGVMSLVVGGRQYRCVLDGDAVLIDGRRHEFEVDDPRSLTGRGRAAGGASGPRPVKSPMPGRVVRVLVAAGDEVLEHQGVVVIEAMKMQNELKAPKAGRVASIAAVVGETVGSGDVLAVIE
jgi:biotin carboxyl carrier protein